MGPAQRNALLEKYRKFLIEEDDVGIERVLDEAPDDPEFFAALTDINRWYEEEFGLTPSPEDQQEGLEQLQRLLGTLPDSTTCEPNEKTASSPLLDDLEWSDVTQEGAHAGEGSSAPMPRADLSSRRRSRRSRQEPTLEGPQSSIHSRKSRATRAESGTPPIKRANAFQKATLAARIVSALHDEPTFGDVKFQKVMYMVEHHAQLHALQSTYKRYEYGPHDTRLFNGAKGMMKKNGWFEAVKSSKRTYFVPLDNPEGYLLTYQKVWGDKDDKIQEVIELFRHLRTGEAEIAATIYAVWNDFIIEGRSFNDADLVYEARYNWNPKKQAIKEQDWAWGIDWLRKTGLVPTGFGKPSKPSSSTGR